MSEPRPRLIVCTTCRAGAPDSEGPDRPGARLHAELARLLTGPECKSPLPLWEGVGGGVAPACDPGRTPPPIPLPQGEGEHRPWLTLQDVACMANCERGCSAALAMPGKWTIFLGHLRPELAADLLTYAATYAAHPTGTVMPSRRPAALRDVVLARLPHLESAA